MSESTKTELKPFHESVVDLINDVGKEKLETTILSSFIDPLHKLRMLGTMLVVTKIPKGHDDIIASWQAQCQRFGLNNDLGVVESVQAQKRVAEEAAHKKKAEADAAGKKPPGLADM